MTKDKNLIHIKKNGGSAMLSHLFNQATVSAEMLLDKTFKSKFDQKLEEFNFNDLIDTTYIPNNYTVTMGIINKYTEERPKIPFFSKVAIRYASKRISNMGYKVNIKNIKIS